MNHKPQRLRITEPGWKNYKGHFGGVEFKDGLSTEVVDPVTASRLGSLIRIQLVDTDTQAGQAADLRAMHETRAAVVPELPRSTEDGSAPKANQVEEKPAHTRESLEAVADSRGIAGLREIATPLGVKSNSIPDMIEKILKAQEPKA